MKTLSFAFVGPECTGKTTLTQQLAAYYRSPFTEEYARKYIGALHRPYTEHDLLLIAKGQYYAEQQVARKAKTNGLYFSDTTLLVVCVWAMEKYGRVDPWIQKKMQQMHYTLQFLCYPDVPWEEDPQREAPEKTERVRLFKIYQQKLEEQKQDFLILRGKLERRVATIQERIKHF